MAVNMADVLAIARFRKTPLQFDFTHATLDPTEWQPDGDGILCPYDR
jgi:hypothetical protein